MLQKLRSRHAIDLPAERWGRRRPTLAILGLIALFFVLVPFLLSLGGAGRLLLGVAAGVGALLLVILLYGLKGKPGWDR